MVHNQTLSLVIQLIHTIFVTSLIIFPLITSKYDLQYSILILLMTFHWFLCCGECIISYIEKKLLNDKYQMGDNANYKPYHNIVTKKIRNIFRIFNIIIFLLIIYRNYKNDNFYLILFFLILSFFLYFARMKYFIY